MRERTLVIGATGKVGSNVVAGLVARAVPVRAATREPYAGGRVLRGAEPAMFDYDRPDTYGPALADVSRLFLSVRPGDDDADSTAIPVLREAAARGVRHVVTLTAMGVERAAGNALRRIEEHVERSGMSWTHLRPNFFMQIFAVSPLLDQLRTTGALRVPAADARLSFVDVRDIAEVAVACLLDRSHAGRAFTLTGPEAIDHATAVRLISGAAGRSLLRYEPQDEDAARQEMVAGGLPPARVERLIGFYRLVRAGACSPVSPDVETVLARPATSFAQFVRDHADAWS